MTQSNQKYEQIIEYFLNNETDKARNLFHEVVVESSREIYESLMDETEISGDKTGDQISDLKADSSADEVNEAFQITAEEAKTLLDYMDGTVTEGHEELLNRVASFYGVAMEGINAKLQEASDELLDIAYGDQGQDAGADAGMGAPGADAGIPGADAGADADAAPGDEMPGDAPAGEGDIEDRVFDLEQALDDLKKEFDDMMGDGGDAAPGDEMTPDADAGADAAPAGDAAPAADAAPAEPTGDEELREYVEKVGAPANTEGQGVADAGKVASVNTKSIVAGKNDMGGSTKNLVKGGENANPDGKTPNKGSGEKPKELIGKVGNTAGGSKKLVPAPKKAHETGEPSGVNKKSLLGR